MVGREEDTGKFSGKSWASWPHIHSATETRDPPCLSKVEGEKQPPKLLSGIHICCVVCVTTLNIQISHIQHKWFVNLKIFNMKTCNRDSKHQHSIFSSSLSTEIPDQRGRDTGVHIDSLWFQVQPHFILVSPLHPRPLKNCFLSQSRYKCNLSYNGYHMLSKRLL